MTTSRVFGLLGLWLALGLAIVWCETRRLRVHQMISRMHQVKTRALESRTRSQLAVHRQTAPAELLANLQRNGVELSPPSCLPPAGEMAAGRGR